MMEMIGDVGFVSSVLLTGSLVGRALLQFQANRQLAKSVSIARRLENDRYSADEISKI